MGNKGFTLIELIVTIVILALIMSIGAYSIISIVNSTRQTNYESLVKNIKSAAEAYAIECKYAQSSSVSCSDEITLGDLVKYGYLTGNGKNNNNEYKLYDSKTNKLISNCKIAISYDGTNNNLRVDRVNFIDSVSGNGCPLYENVYYEFGNPRTSSPMDYKAMVNDGHNVFIASFPDIKNLAVCIVKNRKLGCIKIDRIYDWQITESYLHRLFTKSDGSLDCIGNRNSGVTCYDGNFTCNINSSGQVTCNDTSTNEVCTVSISGGSCR